MLDTANIQKPYTVIVQGFYLHGVVVEAGGIEPPSENDQLKASTGIGPE